MAKADPFPETAMQDVVAEVAEWLPASELPAADMIVKYPCRYGTSSRALRCATPQHRAVSGTTSSSMPAARWRSLALA